MLRQMEKNLESNIQVSATVLEGGMVERGSTVTVIIKGDLINSYLFMQIN